MKLLNQIIAVIVLGAVFTTGALAEESQVDELNALLRGELSAVETYKQALKKVGDEPGSEKVRTMLQEHQDSVEKLRNSIKQAGGTPSTDSGAWGVWAKTVEGTAKILGDTAALKALKEGEKHGLDEYQEALENKDISGSARSVISDVLIPRQQSHIATLDTLMKKI